MQAHVFDDDNVVWMDKENDLDWDGRRAMESGPTEVVETVYTPISDRAVEGISKTIRSSYCHSHRIEKIQKMDKHTIEVVYYGDEFDPDVDHPSEVSKATLVRVQTAIQSLFGGQWRVDYKDDARRRDNKSIQRLVIRRVSALRFKYQEETMDGYRQMLKDTPPGISESAKQWRDTDLYETSIPEISIKPDLYVYETSTGTQHLVKGKWHVRRSSVYEGTECMCGQPIGQDELATEGALVHYADYLVDDLMHHSLYSADRGYTLRQHAVQYDLSLDPQTVLVNLCQRCWRSFASTELDEDGEVVRLSDPLPRETWAELLAWKEADQ